MQEHPRTMTREHDGDGEVVAAAVHVAAGRRGGRGDAGAEEDGDRNAVDKSEFSDAVRVVVDDEEPEFPSDDDEGGDDDVRVSFATAVGDSDEHLREEQGELDLDDDDEEDVSRYEYDYGMWMEAEPMSIQERRRRLLQGMGLASSRDLLRSRSARMRPILPPNIRAARRGASRRRSVRRRRRRAEHVDGGDGETAAERRPDAVPVRQPPRRPRRRRGEEAADVPARVLGAALAARLAGAQGSPRGRSESQPAAIGGPQGRERKHRQEPRRRQGVRGERPAGGGRLARRAQRPQDRRAAELGRVRAVHRLHAVREAADAPQPEPAGGSRGGERRREAGEEETPVAQEHQARRLRCRPHPREVQGKQLRRRRLR